jgi:two-component system, OmpR family, sensor histidine kinase KdpD
MATPTDQRPDPDLLLAKVKREELEARRGKLRIYFGSSAGVGKTYAMLVAARKLAAEGRAVLVGVVETHGRAETATLLEGLEVLPPRLIEYRGKTLPEFDLDAALARRPQLILVDELAHSNVTGTRHPKRWQDVDELLAAGVDVFSTLNVQHLESLNDVVGGITNVRVWETVPDKVFDAADEVVLVDIPADELLARLRAGKVYAHQAEHAVQHFFRKGNLMALRELALRRTADRIEGDVQAYRVDQSIGSVWKTATALLTCVGPDADAERVVRAAARLAGQLNTEWHAIYVETPGLQRLAAAKREKILANLNLAQQLGATTAVIASAEIAESIIGYARTHNLSKLVIGRDPVRRLWPWQRSSGQKLALLAPDIDLIEVGRAEKSGRRDVRQDGRDSAPLPAAGDLESRNRAKLGRLRYLWAAIGCVAVTLVSVPLAEHFDRSNIVAIFILAVVLVGVRLGRGPAALAAVLNVCAFDFFFVPPRFSFAVSDVQYLLTFCIMLAVGLITGQLTAGLRFQARVAAHREERAGALYEFARDLSGAVQVEQVVSISDESIRQTFRADAALLLPDGAGRLKATLPDAAGPEVEIGTAQWAFDRGQPAGFGTDTLPGSEVLYIPLRAPTKARGVLAVKAHNRRLLRIPEQRQLLDTFAALIGIALERVHYVGVAQDALLKMESERLRNSLLAALSHDLRTPLTVLVGLAESLALTAPAELSREQLETAQAIQDEARRMSTMVGNLLDMARIESGEVKLNLQWQPFEEVVGAALEAMRATLQPHTVVVQVPHDLPLIKFDAALIERVLVNLLENAAKYTPPGSTVTLSAQVLGEQLSVSIADNGPGLPPGREEAVFQKFMRGERESATPGVGLGLAICRAIIESHQGRICAAPRAGGGAVFTFTLPLGTPPVALEPEAQGVDG